MDTVTTSSCVPLICSSCQREYELPRRFRIRNDDLDYLVIPRMLNCLHTSCHSCAEEIFQRKTGIVTCPICKHAQKCKGVKYLPYDVSVLYEIMNTNGATSMAFCCRCHDEVPSFSWCFTCLSPLCEFHHQDHRLSIDTRAHEVKTFQDISRSKEHISSALPPMACPEALGHDCSLFCKTCGYMISAQAMIEFHKGHNVVDSLKIYELCNEILESTSLSIQNCIGELMLTFDLTKTGIASLERRVDSIQNRIRSTFDVLRGVLWKREESFMIEVKHLLESNRSRLITKLDKVTDALDACRHVNLKVDKVLTLNGEIRAGDIPTLCGAENQHPFGGSEYKNMNFGVVEHPDREIQYCHELERDNLKHSRSYVISSTKVIKDRCDCICNDSESLFSSLLGGQVECSLHDLDFLVRDQEIKELCNTINTVGSIRNKIEDNVELDTLNSDPTESLSAQEINGSDEKDFESRIKFSVQNNHPLVEYSADDGKNHSKCLTVEIKSSQVNSGSPKLNEASVHTIAKITIEIDVDHLLQPGYEISSFVESSVCSVSPAHLKIKGKVRKI